MDVTAKLLKAMEEYGLEWSEPIVLMRNSQLYTAGKADTHIYYLKEGALRMVHQTGSDLNTIRFAHKGSLFAAMDSLITGGPTAYTAEAIKRSAVLSIRKDAFIDFINNDPKHLELWNEILGYVIIGQLEREIDLLTSSPLERYERVLKRSPQLFQEVPHKYIASYLRMTPETLSRLQKS